MPLPSDGIIYHLSPDFEFYAIFEGVLDEELQPLEVHLFNLLREVVGRRLDGAGS